MCSSMCWTLFIVLALMGVASSGVVGSSKQCSTAHHGCSVEKGECVCGEQIACTNPYPYSNQGQCLKDIKGEFNKCKREPCSHGQCVQAIHGHSRSWECSCAGSGFYGKKCEIKCPTWFAKETLSKDFPSDCIY